MDRGNGRRFEAKRWNWTGAGGNPEFTACVVTAYAERCTDCRGKAARVRLRCLTYRWPICPQNRRRTEKELL